MTELVMDWLTMDVQLPVSTSQFEEGFSNGFLFGELFKKFKQVPSEEEFYDHHTIEAKLANFKRLQPVFKSLGVKASSTRIQEIMAGKRGAALRLLYQVKMALENVRPAQDLHFIDEKPEMFKALRNPRVEYDGHEERFMDGRLRSVSYRESDAQLARKLAKFEEEAMLQEANARELDLIDEERAALQRDRNRQIVLEKAAQTKSFLDDWQRRGYAQWKNNLDHQRRRETMELNFEKRHILRRQERLQNIRRASEEEVAEIDAFEANLTNLGIDSGPTNYHTDTEHDQAVRTMLATTVKVSNAQELHSHFAQSIPTPQEMEQEAETYLKRHKESKYAGHLARQERECRRRKFLVEQHSHQSLDEDKHMENSIMRKLMRESLEEKRIGYQVYKTDRQEDLVRMHRENRNKHYKEKRKEAKRHLIACDQVIAGKDVELANGERKRGARTYRDLERGRLARANEVTASDCEKICGLLADMADMVFDLRQLTDAPRRDTGAALCDSVVWEELCQAFVHGQSADPMVLTPVDAEPYPFPRDPKLPIVEPPMPPPVLLSELPPHTATGRMIKEARPSKNKATRQLLKWELSDYLQLKGPWGDACPLPGEIELPQPDAPEGIVELIPLPEFVDGLPTDYRLGTILQSVLGRKFPPPLPPPPPDMPRVPVRLILNGKQLCGKSSLAQRLAENYNLEVIEVDELIKECMALAGRAEADPLRLTVTEVALNRDEDYGEEYDEYTRQLRELGHHMIAALDRGVEIPDETYVDAIVNKIRAVFHKKNYPPPQDDEPANGWVLVGFPNTAWQYALLERALSGYTAPDLQPKTDLDVRLAAASELAPFAPPITPTEARFMGGVDYHIVIDMPNDEVTRRMAGRRSDPATGLDYHLEDNPPYPLHAIPTVHGELTATFSSTSAFRKQQQVIFERLQQVDPLESALGTLTDRLHIADVNQAEIAEFASNLGSANPDTPRLVTIPDGTPDRIYDLIDELVADCLQRWERQEAEVYLPEVPGGRDEVPPLDFNPLERVGGGGGGGGGGSAAGGSAAGAGDDADDAEKEQPPPEPPRVLELDELKDTLAQLEDRSSVMLSEMWLKLEGKMRHEVTEVLHWMKNARTAWLTGQGEMQSRMLSHLAVPGTQQDTVDQFLDDINRFSDEYPAMRALDTTKAELHARTANLAHLLEEQVQEREASAKELRETMIASEWAEGHEMMLGVLVQRLVQVELLCLGGKRAILLDFYTIASGELPGATPEMPPRLDVLEGELEVDDAAAAAPAAKGKGKPTPEEEAAAAEAAKKKAAQGRKPRVVTDPEVDEDGTVVEPSKVIYPMLDLIFDAAKEKGREVTKGTQWPPGAKEEEEVVEDKGKKAPPPKGKGKPAVEEEEEEKKPPKPMPHAWVDLHVALHAAEVEFEFRLATLRQWAEHALNSMADDAAKLWASVEAMLLLESRAEREAIDAFANEVAGYVERAEKFPELMSLHGNKMRVHPRILLDEPPTAVEGSTHETILESRASVATLYAALSVVRAISRGGLMRERNLDEIRPALWPAGVAKAGDVPSLERKLISSTPPRGELISVEVLLSLGLLEDGDWPTVAELRAFVQRTGVDAVLSEAAFTQLPLFSARSDPSGYDLPLAFRSWVYRVFAEFPADGETEGVSVRRVLGFLALQPTVKESLTLYAELVGRGTTTPISVKDVAAFFSKDGLRPMKGIDVSSEDIVAWFRDLITPPPPGDPGIVTVPPRETPPVYEVDLVQGTLEGGIKSVVDHPALDRAPLGLGWTRPKLF